MKFSKVIDTISLCPRRCKQSRAAAVFFCMLAIVFLTPQKTIAIEGNNFYKPTITASSNGWLFLRDLEKNRITSAKSKLTKSQDMVAIKLFYWWQYSSEKTTESYGKISSFINNHPHWPRQGAMLRLAERKMPSTLDPMKVASWYDRHSPQTGRGTLMYLAALKKLKRNDEIATKSSQYWQNISMGKADQTVFKKRHDTFLKASDYKKRFDMLLFSKKYTEARSLTNHMAKGYRALAEARIALAAKRPGVDGKIKKVPARLRTDAGLMYERLKWRRKRNYNTGAIDILSNPPKAEDINNAKGWWIERHIMIRRLIEKKQYSRAYMLANGHRQTTGFSKVQANWLTGWLALKYVDKPQKSLEIFQSMYQSVGTPISKSRAAYWTARASEKLGKSAEANNWYQTASTFGATYYGQLASQKLSGRTNIASIKHAARNHRNDKRIHQVAYRAAYFHDLKTAAIYLEKAGMKDMASEFRGHTFHRVLEKEGETAAMLYLERIAKQGHWRDALHKTKFMHRNTLGFDPEILFPNVDYPTRKTDGHLINALIRQESMFDTRAQSPVGARGLMQLMPATAKAVAKKHKIRHKKAWLTSNPQHNVELGAAYIQGLLDRYDGHYELAIAAYNAGPGRVNKWLRKFGDPRKGEIEMIEWVEHIPVYETRNYVQRVTENYNVYKAIKG